MIGGMVKRNSQIQCHAPIMPAFGRYGQENQEYKAILGYRASLRLACTT